MNIIEYNEIRNVYIAWLWSGIKTINTSNSIKIWLKVNDFFPTYGITLQMRNMI